METSAFQNSSYEMHFRQISNGRNLIQLIFQNGLVKDCEFSREPKQILDFVEKFSMADDIFKDTYQGNVVDRLRIWCSIVELSSMLLIPPSVT
jgi:hypothetical protein